MTRDQLAYRLYEAMQHGAGHYATGRPYPVRAWDAMRDCDRERFRRRADRYQALAALPRAHRIYAAWFFDGYVPPFPQLTLGVRALWLCVAEAWSDLAAHEQEAA
jgi:hypothetical protein